MLAVEGRAQRASRRNCDDREQGAGDHQAGREQAQQVEGDEDQAKDDRGRPHLAIGEPEHAAEAGRPVPAGLLAAGVHRLPAADIISRIGADRRFQPLLVRQRLRRHCGRGSRRGRRGRRNGRSRRGGGRRNCRGRGRRGRGNGRRRRWGRSRCRCHAGHRLQFEREPVHCRVALGAEGVGPVPDLQEQSEAGGRLDV